ncbi:hypothetical protein EJD97_005828 [Solanum chilense]|uniref:SGNH hydrolase-type esterase domain-containing protein n=1 Tax=Solanum chilense TaxID=4083 RepID=A0A6N2AJM8_SOLCI|nr:hypothetical protein EJD97_005828 [Solanum chilense]
MPIWKEIENYKEYQKRLEAYVGIQKSKYIIEEALYIVSMGTNDFLENYFAMQSVRAFQYTTEQYREFIIGHVENFIKEIYQLGARKISLTGLPPMGCLPLERAANMLRGQGDTCNNDYNDCALKFNEMLSALIQKLNKELPGIRIAFANPYGIILQMVQNPASFGFEVERIACCDTGLFEMSYLCNKLNPLTCPDPNKYVFWDSFHLTQKTNQIITNSLMKNVLHQFV